MSLVPICKWTFLHRCSYLFECNALLTQCISILDVSDGWFDYCLQALTDWGWLTHICVSKLTIIGSDNGLLPGQRQAIIWTNPGILLIGHQGTNFSEIQIKIHIFSLKKIHLKMSSGKKKRPFCLCLNEFSHYRTHSGLVRGGIWHCEPWSSLAKIVDCHLFDTRPLLKPILNCFQLDP